MCLHRPHLEIRFLVVLLVDFVLCTNAAAQSINSKPDSIKVIALPDVEVTSSSRYLSVSSGTENNHTSHIISPGGGKAIRFLAPKSDYHELSRVRLQLGNHSKLKEGQIQVRLASVADDGSPSGDTLLPSILLSTADLRRAQRHITLQWPQQHFYVPIRGFFVVVEGIGRTSDEYVSGLHIAEGSKNPPLYKMSSRTQPGTVIRLVDADNFPTLKGTKPDANNAEFWERDTVTRQWRVKTPGTSVLLMEAFFE